VASASGGHSGRDGTGEEEEIPMRKRTVAAATGMGVAAAVTVGGVAFGAGGDDGGPVSATEAEHATSAALEATGGGRSNSVERDSENGATWEVEVTKEDGSTVDVRLDERYRVVVIEGDSEPR
jgi:hypothetical protein